MAVQSVGFLGGQMPSPQGLISQQAQNYLGVGALPQIQRSEYLANALQSLQERGGQNLKSGAALGYNLLADALLNVGRDYENQSLIKAIEAGQAKALDAAKLGTGYDTPSTPTAVSPPAAVATPPASSVATPSAPSGGAGAGGPVATDHPLAAALSPHAAPLTSDQVTALQADPAAFIGIPGIHITSGARSAAHNAAVGGVPTSEHIPGNGYAYDFVPPKGMTNAQAITQIAASGIPYDQLIQGGNHIHIGWRPQGVAERGQLLGMPAGSMQMAGNPSAAPSAMPPGGVQVATATGSPTANAQPYQVASNGPGTPPPPAMGQGSAPAPAMPPGGPMQPPPPMPAQGPPTGPQITPQERQVVGQLLSFPPGSQPYMRGMAMLQEIQQRAITPIPLDKGEYFDPSGQARSVHYAPTVAGPTPWTTSRTDPLTGQQTLTAIPNAPYTDVPGAPNAYTQRGPDNQLHVQGNPAYGAVGEGRMLTPGGANVPQGGMPAPGAGGQFDPKAPIPPALLPQYNDLTKQFREGKGYTDYVTSLNAANALEGVLKNAAGPNGVVAQAALDNGIRAMTGLSARIGSVNSLIEHIDLPDQVKGEISRVMGGMYLTPAVIGQLRDMIRGYSAGHLSLAQQEYEQYNSAAHRMGFDLGLTLPQMAPAGHYTFVNDPGSVSSPNASTAPGAPAGPSGLFAPPRGGPAAGQGAGNGVPQITAAQARAELARRQAQRARAGQR